MAIGVQSHSPADSLDAYARAKLARLEAGALRRSLEPTERCGAAEVLRAGRRLISFSCNDYLGLAQDPRLKRAAVEAIERFGVGAAASRLVTGDHPLFYELESALAAYKATPAAVVFGSGYLTNIGAPPALVGEGDLILIDELAHSCMFAGARLSRARAIVFRHNDVEDLRAILRRERSQAKHVLILTETVFSMDGDRAPLAEIAQIAQDEDAWLLSDDAHGLGVVDCGPKAPLQMGTLSKALGSYGGYLCASAAVIDLMKNRARSFVYTTGLPPASAAAALAALGILRAEPERGARVLSLARQFTRAVGLPEAQSAIVPIPVGDSAKALRYSQALEQCGFLAVAIRPPTVPAGTARLRIAFSAAHTPDQVDGLARAIRDLRERA